MSALLDRLDVILPWLGPVAVIVAFLLAEKVVPAVIRKRGKGSQGVQFRIQLTMVVVTLAALILIVVVLPVGDTLRGQLLSLLGILFSAAIALSSTTFIGNALAGVMLRTEHSFHAGDWIQVEGHLGRVSGRGLLSTEIQTEDRDLITLPNLYLVTHPLKTVRASGHIVSVEVGLGYDIPRTRVEELLLAAASGQELEDPFVQILELGDHAITYRVAGLLTETKQMITRHSRLRGAVLDALHGGGVEIVSPAFMNQRVLDPDRRFIPEPTFRAAQAESESPAPETIAFDKAEEAGSLELMKAEARKLSESIASLQAEAKEADSAGKEALEKECEARKRQLDILEQSIERRAREIEEAGKDPGD